MGKAYGYSNVEEMKSDGAIAAGDICFTFGFREPNDGGSGFYMSGGGSPNDMNVHDNKAAPTVLSLIYSEAHSIKQFGAKGDGSDATKELNEYIKWCDATDTVNIPAGEYGLSGVSLNNGRLKGVGKHKTKIKLNGDITISGKDCCIQDVTLIGGGININCSNCIISNVNIQNSSTGITLSGGDSVSISKVDMENCQTGINISGNCKNVCIRDISCINSQKGIITSGEQFRVSVYSSLFKTCSECGAIVASKGSYSFYDCYFEDCCSGSGKAPDKGGLCIMSEPKVGTILVSGCSFIKCGVAVARDNVAERTFISNYFKDVSGYCMLVPNYKEMGGKRIINISAYYDNCTNRTNDLGSIRTL